MSSLVIEPPQLNTLPQNDLKLIPGSTTQPLDNYSIVVEGAIYRSGFPTKEHFPFVKELGIKTVIALTTGEYPQENLDFYSDAKIQFLQYHCKGKENMSNSPVFRQALSAVMNPDNQPVLVNSFSLSLSLCIHILYNLLSISSSYLYIYIFIFFEFFSVLALYILYI